MVGHHDGDQNPRCGRDRKALHVFAWRMGLTVIFRGGDVEPRQANRTGGHEYEANQHAARAELR